jgi:hypothetical protein
MTQVVRTRRLKRFLVGVWFVVGGTGTLAIHTDTLPEPERARLWAQDRESPVAFSASEFASYPTSYRAELYKVLPPETKRRLWIEHLTSLQLRTDFSSSQHAFVQKFLGLIRSDSSLVVPGVGEKVAADLCAEARSLFRGDDRKLFQFRSIGTALPSRNSWTGSLLTLSNRMAAMLDAKADIHLCECDGTCDCVLKYEDLDVSCSEGGCTPGLQCGCIFPSTCTGDCYCWEGEQGVRCKDLPGGDNRAPEPDLQSSISEPPVARQVSIATRPRQNAAPR